jgi:thioredoxin 1
VGGFLKPEATLCCADCADGNLSCPKLGAILPQRNPPMASQNLQVFNDLNFEQEVLTSKVPVLVDFTATWCGPCKALAPIVDQLADELSGSVKVGKLDIDDSPLTAGKYGVRGVPTVMVFKAGERAAQHVGLTTKQKLLDLVKV